MSPRTTAEHSDLETITCVIARSPIVIAAPAQTVAPLPAGYDQVDIAVLRWIALESQRTALARH
jgi:hypothetical protein